jgi:uncharacterized protein YbaR (Trm112 family)
MKADDVFQIESTIMKLARMIGMKRLAWAMRRLHVPVSAEALVLDVGSGGNPYPRANVLLDAYEDTIERFNVPLVKDRPFVIGLIEKLPFKDKAFDFVIASHVLEHSTDPAAFLDELQRVGKAGYIETPDAFFEKICPYTFHRLEVTENGDTLEITKKESWCPHKEIVELYQRKFNRYPAWVRYLSDYPYPFYTRFYWKDKIKYTITNPDVSARWALPENKNSVANINIVRRGVVSILRWFFSQRKRNQNIDLVQLLRCPTCNHEKIKKCNNELICEKCGSSYPMKNGIPFIYPPK